ncbi:MAG: DUF4190 domain-containing protein, partial [Thermodesulfovibrionales bacterium]|nr:DUF4190 domain-containing protein [Thermodesulfovibrionales bacterium]
MEDHCTATDKDNKKLPRTSVFAVISLLAGLSGSIFIFHMELQRYIAIPEIIALAAGYFSLREIKRSESLLTGKTLSFLGILFGCIFIVASILLPYIDSR